MGVLPDINDIVKQMEQGGAPSTRTESIVSVDVPEEAQGVDIFLKIDGVDGESADDRHKGEIDIIQYAWTEAQMGTAGSGGGSGAGKVQKMDLSVLKRVDKSSPVLFIACATGKHYKNAVLTARKAGGEQQDYLKVTMEEVLVSGYQAGASGATTPVPVEVVSLNFGRLEMSYREQKADGSLGPEVKQKYDFGKNVRV